MKIETIIRQFFDFEQFMEAAAFGTGHINDTFKVKLLQNGEVKNWLLQRLNHHVFREPEAVMHNIQRVAEHLQKQSYPMAVLSPATTRSGNLLYVDALENYWRVFPFFEKTIAFDKVEKPEQAYQAAKAFGAFSRALDGMDSGQLKTTIPGFHDGLQRLAYFETVLKRALPDRLADAKKEVAEILEHKNIFKKIASLNLPLRITHHDTKINNVLFSTPAVPIAIGKTLPALNQITSLHPSQTPAGFSRLLSGLPGLNQPVCVIDLDTVMPGIVLSDFGDMMRTFTSPVDEDEPDFSKVEMQMPVFQALKEGFLSEMDDKLTSVERENLTEGGRWLALMQAVRFLADYLEGDVYYKTKYPAHNLVRASNQLALFRSMTTQL